MRIIWRIIGSMLVILVVLVVSLPLLPGERLGRIASDQLTRQLGREVTLGDVSLTIWPEIGIEADQIRLANADWSDNGAMLTAERARIGIDTLAALTGQIRFRTIRAEAPRILLERNATGAANWELGAGSGGDAPLPVFTLDELSILDGTLRYAAVGAAPVDIRGLDLTLAWPDRDGPATIDARFSPATQPLTLTARIDSPARLMSGGATRSQLSLTAPGGTLRFEGVAGTAPEAAGSLRFDIESTERFLAALGQPGMILPEGLGRRAVGTADLTLTPDGTLSLRNADLRLDDNALTLTADIFSGDVPRVSARISAESLKLPTLAGAGSDAEGWPTEPLDASVLSAVNGDLSLEFGELELGEFEFGRTRARMSLEDARAVFDIGELQGYEGDVSGQFVVNNRAGLSVGGTLDMAGIELRDLAEDAAGITRFAGKTDGQIRFLGSGQSVDAIMQSLSGEGSLRAGPGVISGLDLDAVFRGGVPGSGTTVFDVMTATFEIGNGVLRNEDLTLNLPVLEATGEGKIDLGGRSLDYLVTATSPQARDGRGLSVPVRIKGPWDDAEVRADLEAAIEANFAEEKQELENRARDAVGEALQDRLGVTLEPGQSVEDALRDRLRDEAAKGLLKLFER